MPFVHSALSNLDAAQTAFFARDLEKIKKETYDAIYPENKGRFLVPASSDPADPSDEFVTFRTFDRVGLAEMVAAYAKDLPRVDVIGKESRAPLRRLGAAVGFNYDEMLKSAKLGAGLDGKKLMAAREAIEAKLDELIAIGDVSLGFRGFLNASNVPAASVATVGGATTWADKAAISPDYVLADLRDQWKDMIDLTHGRERPDSVVMPEDKFADLSAMRLQDQNCTVLDFLKRAMPEIKNWEPWYRCTNAGSGGSVDRVVMYAKNQRKLWTEIPQEFTALPPQERGLETVINCVAKSGGVNVAYPLSLSYRDGI